MALRMAFSARVEPRIRPFSVPSLNTGPRYLSAESIGMLRIRHSCGLGQESAAAEDAADRSARELSQQDLFEVVSSRAFLGGGRRAPRL